MIIREFSVTNEQYYFTKAVFAQGRDQIGLTEEVVISIEDDEQDFFGSFSLVNSVYSPNHFEVRFFTDSYKAILLAQELLSFMNSKEELKLKELKEFLIKNNYQDTTKRNV